MVTYLGNASHASDAPAGTGLLLANLGTPEAPTPAALRRYLGEFLSDPRVIKAPRWLWRPILHGFVLRIRPRRSAAAYRKIWQPEGSPLKLIGERQAGALRTRLRAALGEDVPVALGMRYGSPSIAEAMEALREAGVDRLVVLPLYPQYSSTTTASTFDAVAAVLRRWWRVPELRFVPRYHQHPGYIEALAASVREEWRAHGQGERLLLSFHGLPERYHRAGDPYYWECRQTAERLAETLGLGHTRWALGFQSRFGREPWLKPYTDELLQEWARAGVRSVDVLCPGFAADCLETLEEIAMQNRDLFLGAGGETFRYIPALNDRADHIEALAELVLERVRDWHALTPSAPERVPGVRTG